MPPYELIRPTSEADWQAYQAFRWDQLRAPWLPERSAEFYSIDPLQEETWLAREPAAGNILACGQLHWQAGGVSRLRNMAVAPHCRGTGLGRAMLQRLEAMARGRGCHRIIAQARDTALNFYTTQGYRMTGPGETLFDQIPHQWIEKTLDCTDFSHFGLRLHAARNTDSAELRRFIFQVLAEYGLMPETDGIDQDLIAPQSTYAGGFFDLLRNPSGTLQGTVALLPISQHKAELRRMYLAAPARGHGLGRAALGYALQRARQLGFTRLTLETASVLREARSLYAWAGFVADDGPMHARRCDQRLRLEL